MFLALNESKKVIAISVLFCVVFALTVSAQKSSSLKLGEFYPSAETVDVFDSQVSALLNSLREADKDTSGYINIYESSELAARLNRLTTKEPELRKRIYLFTPGVRYRVDIEHVAFWLVPKGSDAPFPANCVLCECPTLNVVGPLSLFENGKPKDSVSFTATITGGASLTYHWTISNGIISSGQGTASIEVKPNIAWEKDVDATVEIGGLDPSCNCMQSASFTSKFPLK